MFLARLTECAGVSGQEAEVRAVIIEEIKDYVDGVKVDALGNVIALKRGRKAGDGGVKLMLAAHMDEVGLMVTYIEKSGMLRVEPVGGVDPRVLVSKVVLVGKDKIPGVIGAKAIHLQEREERENAFKIEDLLVDIGAKDKQDAEKAVRLGDAVVFATEFQEIGNRRAKAKAFDDRVGCAVVAELLKQRFDYTVYGVFTAQEEVGGRGATVAAYSINPDLALVFEGTTASDVPEAKEHTYATTLGKGPALTFMDRSVLVKKDIIKRLLELAEEGNIPVQFRRSTAGGTDAGRIYLQREGIPSEVISVPTRYIHSPVSVIDLADVDNTIRLASAFLHSIEDRGLPL
ncbi:MAG TPA: M42 family metallopeptidase [Firmicutes bacterium]|nr:M42 family metallopeptidase [Bacillota bacterium]